MEGCLELLEFKESVDRFHETKHLSIVKKMINLFDEEWIISNQEHVLHKLIKRQDIIAEMELDSFAASVRKLRKISPQWLNNQIKIIKQNDINNQKGAMFEILGLGSLIGSENYEIIPASMGNPGYDGIVQFRDGSKINLSMKNFGISRFQKDYYDELKKIRNILVDEMNIQSKNGIQCEIIFNEYPSFSMYNRISDIIKGLVSRYNEEVIEESVDNQVLIRLRKLPYKFSIKEKSYLIFALSPEHKNEFANLRDKLEEACVNLSKNDKGKDEINGIWIHLHENANIKKCQEYVQNYIGNKVCPIDLVLLYQPSIARNLIDRNVHLHHTILPAINMNYIEWYERHRNRISLSFPIGLHSNNVAESNIFINNQKREIDLTECYFYQRGDLYIDDGEDIQVPYNFAPGFFIHKIFSENIIKTVTPNYPEYEFLSIL